MLYILWSQFTLKHINLDLLPCLRDFFFLCSPKSFLLDVLFACPIRNLNMQMLQFCI